MKVIKILTYHWKESVNGMISDITKFISSHEQIKSFHNIDSGGSDFVVVISNETITLDDALKEYNRDQKLRTIFPSCVKPDTKLDHKNVRECMARRDR